VRPHLEEATQRTRLPEAIERLLDSGHRACASTFGDAERADEKIRDRIAGIDVHSDLGKWLP
jgi:hypothetical protein